MNIEIDINMNIDIDVTKNIDMNIEDIYESIKVCLMRCESINQSLPANGFHQEKWGVPSLQQ